jgi:hypothetical protein
MVVNGANDDPFAVLTVINIMRLKPEPAKARSEFFRHLADARKIGEQAKGALQPGKVGVRLIAAEGRGTVVVDFMNLCASTRRKPMLPMPRGNTRSGLG